MNPQSSFYISWKIPLKDQLDLVTWNRTVLISTCLFGNTSVLSHVTVQHVVFVYFVDFLYVKCHKWFFHLAHDNSISCLNVTYLYPAFAQFCSVSVSEVGRFDISMGFGNTSLGFNTDKFGTRTMLGPVSQAVQLNFRPFSVYLYCYFWDQPSILFFEWNPESYRVSIKR